MRSLRGRVALVASAVVALGFLLTGLVVLTTARRQAVDRLDTDLQERLELLTDAGRVRPDGPRGGFGPGAFGPGGFDPGGFGPGAEHVVDLLSDAAEGALGRGFFLAVRGPDGTVLATLGDQPAGDPPAADPGTTTTFVDDDGRRWRTATVDASRQGLVQLQIGGDVGALVGESLADLRTTLLVVGGAATVVTGLATTAAASAATRPLRRLGAATRTVAETQDLSTRVPTDGVTTEIAEVSEALNTLLARLEASTGAQRAALHGAQRFAADAGHELRTPLTALQATLDALERNPDAPPTVRAAATAEAAGEVRRLSGLLASLQALARADAGLGAERAPVDLADVVAQAVEAAAVRHPEATFTGPGGEDPVVVPGAEPWLRSIADNLLANAAVHGRPGGQVRVAVTAAPRAVTLTVDDDGPGIPLPQREAVFHRFVRGADADDRPGSGLGLSLVAQLVALHGGDVRIDDSPLGGARVVVTLPA